MNLITLIKQKIVNNIICYFEGRFQVHGGVGFCTADQKRINLKSVLKEATKKPAAIVLVDDVIKIMYIYATKSRGF